MEFTNITTPNYRPEADPANGIIKVFRDMVHSYLNIVQRNAFPPDFLQNLQDLQDTSQNSSETVKKALTYEIGFLVALAFGVLFFVLMPLTGFCFCCCRCCGNCGGKMHQKQTKKMACKRRFIYIFLLCITLIMLAGNICMFYSNSKVSSGVKDGISSYNNTMENLKTYVNSVPKEVDLIIGQSDSVIQYANNSIIAIDSVLGGAIKSEIEAKANETLDLVVQTINVVNNTANLLVAINDSFNSLRAEQEIIQGNLSDVQTRINNTLNKCGTKCDSAKNSVDGLTFDVSYQIPDLSDPLNRMNDFLGSGIDSTLQKVRKAIDDIPETVKNDTRDAVQRVQDQLGKIKSTINDTKNAIPITSTVNSALNGLNSISTSVSNVIPQIQNYDYYRWIVGIILSCIILLIILCILFGLILGPLGLKGTEDPTKRNCASNSGGDFFMASVGFSFIFSWLLILIVAVLFVVGGNSYTLVCKPWANQQLFTYLDSQTIPQLNISHYIDTNVNISTLYSDCQRDDSLWSTLNFNQKIDLQKYLNITQYTDSVQNIIDNTNITIKNINFLTTDQKDQIMRVVSSGVDTLNFASFKSQLIRNITKIDLLSFADDLDKLANDSSLPENVTTELRTEASVLRRIDNHIKSNLIPAVETLDTTVQTLEATSENMPATLNKTLANIEEAQAYIDTQTVGVIKNATTAYVNKLVDLFQSYVDWAIFTLRTNFARCGPVAKAVNSAQTIACVYIVDSVNAFWFSLGWCTLFLIPSIILSVKLAKHYRRMKSSDVYENEYDQMEMTTSRQFLFPRVQGKA
ncbi:hypothetical protein XENTR_v10018121 [Xenopus tropicalis]|uniref:Prominin 3 n=2 Tax=Xenopus tropicalis TaxID=8364 RepID=E9LYZ7_XENTR|nr:prominin 3 isoform X1 [Xenopus tropicalis]XP_031760770.1 prominin 3 isoform X1 [Xenopus tropicalis]XP_031760771.1 prominin 3 isoform X1 [Xenopus tropicalis]XP_031760772.1 prominin 3 isoform X1 [Xenopus tropicalis]ADW76754.1 prominin-3 splice variant 1 [Xenopus tropicalis]KAE8590583.1 hypothetical protein XENTR_v10018121 [Xenopus tropicalis]KAE8590584.1 hypothetical protein XENTR_v10018121 [Xenopus tropicalis]